MCVFVCKCVGICVHVCICLCTSSVLNSQVIKKYKNNELNIDYYRLGIDFDDHMMPVGEVCLKKELFILICNLIPVL